MLLSGKRRLQFLVTSKGMEVDTGTSPVTGGVSRDGNANNLFMCVKQPPLDAANNSQRIVPVENQMIQAFPIASVPSFGPSAAPRPYIYSNSLHTSAPNSNHNNSVVHPSSATFNPDRPDHVAPTIGYRALFTDNHNHKATAENNYVKTSNNNSTPASSGMIGPYHIPSIYLINGIANATHLRNSAGSCSGVAKLDMATTELAQSSEVTITPVTNNNGVIKAVADTPSSSVGATGDVAVATTKTADNNLQQPPFPVSVPSGTNSSDIRHSSYRMQVPLCLSGVGRSHVGTYFVGGGVPLLQPGDFYNYSCKTRTSSNHKRHSSETMTSSAMDSSSSKKYLSSNGATTASVPPPSSVKFYPKASFIMEHKQPDGIGDTMHTTATPLGLVEPGPQKNAETDVLNEVDPQNIRGIQFQSMSEDRRHSECGSNNSEAAGASLSRTPRKARHVNEDPLHRNFSVKFLQEVFDQAAQERSAVDSRTTRTRSPSPPKVKRQRGRPRKIQNTTTRETMAPKHQQPSGCKTTAHSVTRANSSGAALQHAASLNRKCPVVVVSRPQQFEIRNSVLPLAGKSQLLKLAARRDRLNKVELAGGNSYTVLTKSGQGHMPMSPRAHAQSEICNSACGDPLFLDETTSATWFLQQQNFLPMAPLTAQHQQQTSSFMYPPPYATYCVAPSVMLAGPSTERSITTSADMPEHVYNNHHNRNASLLTDLDDESPSSSLQLDEVHPPLVTDILGPDCPSDNNELPDFLSSLDS